MIKNIISEQDAYENKKITQNITIRKQLILQL